ncbi:tetraacyldisaccharide 4'-kinase [Aureibaculum sp. 2210JD6-5]|uniref:tetraacyldisaccharide 4'-kinase n=1 Tax=Aureibaculum sp. 2210JD6-5 TaxID=3103957 RepID=UPI002AACDEF6|nr:tetraacyldisaccharide 4'-kinase [Aureibaculum sp. 2210JD6-5]MDY7396134.1 tetraacyldisaccharide 4'-kinase [Aureibaculum sp. 2210JD6-5]
MGFLRKILYPFSVLYGEITAARNTFYDKGILKSTQFDVPTIVVGNLSVGGTGKTPQVEYLARLLQDDHKVAILSRGYKRSTKGFIIASATSTADKIGDEPLQYFKKFPNIIVAVDADRVNGIKQLTNLLDTPDVILLDDAFQHRKVEAGLNILLTPYNDLYVDDKMLPTGNLREKVSGAERAQLIVVTKCPAQLNEKEQFEVTKKLNIENHQTVFFSNIKYGNKILGKSNSIAIEKLSEYKIVLVTGIAKTQPLTEFLTAEHLDFQHLKYADHYSFSEKDLAKVAKVFDETESDKKIILTTEKDYVRSFIDTALEVYYLPIETGFIDHQTDFNKIVKDYVEQGSRNS